MYTNDRSLGRDPADMLCHRDGGPAPGEQALEILIDTEELTGSLRSRLMEILKEYPGRSGVYLRLRDRRSGRSILFFSKAYAVSLAKELTDRLEKAGFRCRITNGEQ
jgi:hypothetical protein